jgi:hypothetical protein
MARTNFEYACGGFGSTRVTERVWAVPGPFSLLFNGKPDEVVGARPRVARRTLGVGQGEMIAQVTGVS